MKRDLCIEKKTVRTRGTTSNTAGVQGTGVSDLGRTSSSYGVAVSMVVDMGVAGVHGTLFEDIKRRRHIGYCLIRQGSCRKERS